MRRWVVQTLDRWVIRRATSRLQAELVRQPKPAGSKPEPGHWGVSLPPGPLSIDLAWAGETGFEFQSPQPSPWPENNVVYGRVYRAGPDWTRRPSVVLLHGWRGEQQYRWQFPWLARCLNRRGLNAVFFELPLHGRRQPRSPGAPRDWIWPGADCARIAATQALAETEALLAWLVGQGSACVGVWGFSLGGWLAGLVACRWAALRWAVLFCPVARMDRAVGRLPFCAPLEPFLEQGHWPLAELDLSSQRPRLPLRGLLLVAAQHDLFVPVEELEALWAGWGQPELWRLPHGHMSALMAPVWLRRVVNWIAQRASGT